VLTFRLTVIDNAGATAVDDVPVTMIAASGDATAPVTTLTQVRSRVKGVVYFYLTLTVNEPATTYFRLTGEGIVTSGGTSAWQTYTDLVKVQLYKSGTAHFDYSSVDTSGNQEATRTEVLQ
jgi:hypothetical protein